MTGRRVYPAASQDAGESSFARNFGGRAEGVWSAPGRVNFIGEHTDYNGGFVLPIALPHRMRVHARRRDDGMLHIASTAEPLPEVFDVAKLRPGVGGGWSVYAAAMAWALRDAGHRVGGAELLLDGDVPVGAGLSSSAALECAVGKALCGLYGVALTAFETALLAQRAENLFVGVPCGVMDQMASMCCTPGHALLLDTRSLAFAQVPMDLAGAGLRLLVVDTRARHALADGEYAARRRECELAAVLMGADALRDIESVAQLNVLRDPVLRARARHVVTENARVLRTVELVHAHRLWDTGPLLTASHLSLRDDFAVSCSELDLAVQAALDAGALGARMTGGGFGGSAIALVDADEAERVSAAVRRAFAEAGLREPRIFEAVPSAGAA
ncbi:MULTISPECIES: galactokinase [unclassified Streptomyces]|uniref:galactokinase n=1 Tax=unclassified Streptomyces TaxID=2593676 RepID=UPI001BE7D71D|nr:MULTISPECIES: galactokinase [unclassified Streptomyces]MBT2406209.1 galactokinase [Streptomyces sp. ISL-21]MBT2459006.1 galactokinase [Streptomyces sp. ISL-86]MBT2609509.1 galactokinase [Streptomyces sp. ISL-87]